MAVRSTTTMRQNCIVAMSSRRSVSSTRNADRREAERQRLDR